MPGKQRPPAEQILSNLSRLLAKENFATEEEMNARLLELTKDGAIPEAPVETNADRAWQLLEQADATENPKRRAALTRQAIAVDPDCADAYLLLAQDAPTNAEAMSFFREAVQAGERSLPTSIESLAAEGAVWYAHESRPYMRARAALAIELWHIGDRQPAIESLWDLLRLNPADKQGLRYVLLGWLLAAGSIAAIERLFALFPEDGAAAWLFDRALHAFRTEGDSAASRKLLDSALRQNPHVLPMLLGEVPLSGERSEYVGYGDEAEAEAYVAEALLRWSESPDAVEWMIAKAGKRRRPRYRADDTPIN